MNEESIKLEKNDEYFMSLAIEEAKKAGLIK